MKLHLLHCHSELLLRWLLCEVLYTQWLKGGTHKQGCQVLILLQPYDEAHQHMIKVAMIQYHVTTYMSMIFSITVIKNSNKLKYYLHTYQYAV